MRITPLTKWLTACSHTRVIPQHNTGSHTRMLKHVTFKFYHCHLTPRHCQSATNWDSNRITQCVSLCADGTMPPLCLRPEKEQGVRSSLGEAGDCERGKGGEGGVRDDHWLCGRMNCSSGYLEIAPLATSRLSFPISKPQHDIPWPAGMS